MRPLPAVSPCLSRSAAVAADPKRADRRSIAGYDSVPYSPDDVAQTSPPLAGGLSRSQTVLRREGARKGEQFSPQPSPLPQWSPDFGHLPSPNERGEAAFEGGIYEGDAPMSQYQSNTPGKSSSDSGQSTALDRWSQRRLQRLNTEQGFREQRQGGQQPGVLSPPLSQESSYSNASGAQYAADAQPQQQQHQHAQPGQPHPSAYQAPRTGPASQPNAGLGVQTQSVSTSSSRPNNYPPHDAPLPQTYSPPEPPSQFPQDASRPPLTQSRSFNSQQEDSMSSNNGSQPAAKTSRSGINNRQSVHNGISSREGSALSGQGGNHTGVPAYNTANVASTAEQGYGTTAQQQQKGSEPGRGTPQPNKPMTKEDIEQLIQDHAQLRTCRARL